MPAIHDPLLPEGRGHLEHGLAERLAETARPGHRLAGVRRLGEGVKAVSWLLELDHADAVVAKFFRPEAESRMQREVGFHTACTLKDERLPTLLGVQAPQPGRQLGVVLTSHLPGRRLADQSNTTPAQKRQTYTQAATLLKALHASGMQEEVDQKDPMNKGKTLHASGMQGFGPLGAAREHDDARARAVALAEVAIDRCARAEPELAPPKRVFRWLRERAQSVDASVDPVLCHGDFSMWNMLVELEEGRPALRGVIDFESSYAGDPLMDLASVWVLTDAWGAPGTAELAAIEAGYGPLRVRREADFEFYVALETLKLWWYYAERGAARSARDVAASLTRQTGR